MKKTALLIGILICGFLPLQAQKTVKTANTNWIYTKTYTQPGGSDYVGDITYFDGLGYPYQAIQVGASPAGYGLVQPYFYDALRQDSVRRYLPYENNSTSAELTADPLSAGWYARTYDTGDPYVYSEFTYDGTPLERLLRARQPGVVFRNPDKCTTVDYAVAQGTIDESSIWLLSIWMDGGLYPSILFQGQKMPNWIKTTVTNEDGSKSITFTDAENRTVLTRIENGAQLIDTYYIYDNFGRLAWVVTPEATAKLRGGQIVGYTDDLALDHCYFYGYDGRGNITFRHIPGRSIEGMKYDLNNRLVVSYDGGYEYVGSDQVQYSHMTYEYDALGRVTQQHLVKVSYPRAGEDVAVHYKELDKAPVASSSQLVASFIYDAPPPGSSQDWRMPLAVPGVFDPAQLNGSPRGYKTQETLAVLNDKWDNGTPEYVTRVYYYDRKGRLVQSVQRNATGGVSRTTTKYDFTDQVLVTLEQVQTKAGAAVDTKRVEYEYDARGRMLAETTTLNDCDPVVASFEYDKLGRLTATDYPLCPVSITQTQAYNLQGWLTTKDNPKFRMSLRYYDPLEGAAPSYTGNISEWSWGYKDAAGQVSDEHSYVFTYDELSRLTNAGHKLNGVADGLFEEQNIRYDMNGNILGMVRTPGNADFPGCSYIYQYNGNRISTISKFDVYPGTLEPNPRIGLPFIVDSLTISPHKFFYSYDSRGNMVQDIKRDLTMRYNLLNLLQKVETPVLGGGTRVTNYSYLADGTKLNVIDAYGNGNEYHGSMVYTSTKGSLTLDSTPFTGGRITRRQSIWGGEIEKPGGGVIVAKDNQGAGVEAEAYFPRYFLTDHLGSVRVVLDETGKGVEWNDYYPYGSLWGQPSLVRIANNYRYNGKELQPEGYLDYGSRKYDTDYPTWRTPDPQAERYYSISPYAYCAGNPVKYIDPNGERIEVKISENQIFNSYFWTQNDSGVWGFYDAQGNAYAGNNEFMMQLTEALGALMSGGPAGYDLVSGVANDSRTVTLSQGRDSAASNTENLMGWNPTGTGGTYGDETVPTTGGMRNDPMMTLGHELAHILDRWSGAKHTVWYNSINKDGKIKPVYTSEIYTTHIENRLRAENALPLRTHYGKTTDGFTEGPRVLNSNGASRYYDINGITNFKPLKKGTSPYVY